MKFSSKTINAGANAKTVKGDGEWITAILYMAPYKLAKGINVCPLADLAGCASACLNTAGRGKFNSIQTTRIKKTQWYADNRDDFMDQLDNDVLRFQKKCDKENKKPAIRLNGTSDIRWELYKYQDGKNIFQRYPNIQFYDYTKISNRKVSDIPNYHLTWSYSEASPSYADGFQNAVDNDMNIAVVFRDKKLPEEFKGLKVIDGDKDDLRFLDPKSVIVGLYAKGDAKKDKTGFVIDI